MSRTTEVVLEVSLNILPRLHRIALLPHLGLQHGVLRQVGLEHVQKEGGGLTNHVPLCGRSWGEGRKGMGESTERGRKVSTHFVAEGCLTPTRHLLEPR